MDCIYIDLSYNIGNEERIYNDNATSPMMKEWLKGKSPLDGEDWKCHDEPRLSFLRSPTSILNGDRADRIAKPTALLYKMD